MSALSFTCSGGGPSSGSASAHTMRISAPSWASAPVAADAAGAGDAAAVALATGFSSLRVHAGTLVITNVAMTIQRKTRMRPPRAKYAATITKFDAARIVANEKQGVKVRARRDRRRNGRLRERQTGVQARRDHTSTQPKLHFAIVHTSRGLSPSLRTTEASKPLCMRQSRQRWSWRDSQ